MGLVAAGSVTLVSSVAQGADPTGEGAETRESATSAIARSPRPKLVWLEGSAGFGTPLGWVGGSLVLRPSDSLAMHAGAGLGTQGLQVAAGGRAFLPVSATRALGLGVTWSIGPYAAIEAGVLGFQVGTRSGRGQSPETYVWGRAHSVNVEVSFSSRDTQSTFALRPFLGLGYVVNGGDATCANVNATLCTGPARARLVPFIGVAAAFGLL